MNIYIIIGVSALIGIIALVSWNSKKNSNTFEISNNRTELRNNKSHREKRDLKLIVTYDYG